MKSFPPLSNSFTIVAFAVGLPLLCLTQSAQSKEFNPVKGLTLDHSSMLKAVGQPPGRGSVVQQRDLDILYRNQKTREPEEVSRSWAYLNKHLSSFQAAIGADINKAPRIQRSLPMFVKLVSAFQKELKIEFRRKRPYLSYPDIKPCLPLKDNWSYPSGHATWYNITSLLMADLLPQRRERILEVARQAGHARTYCGVHYPSDIEAAQRIAAAAATQIINSPQWKTFKSHPKTIKEVKKLLIPPPSGLPVMF